MRAGYNGVDEDYTLAMKWKVETGRFISEEDVKNATKVVVLGKIVATELFGEVSPLRKENEAKLIRVSDEIDDLHKSMKDMSRKELEEASKKLEELSDELPKSNE